MKYTKINLLIRILAVILSIATGDIGYAQYIIVLAIFLPVAMSQKFRADRAYIAGAIMGLIAQSEERDLQSDLGDELKNRPRYGSANKNLAAARAFGRSKEAMIADESISQDAADAGNMAREATNSTSGLLATIAAIGSNQSNARRQLAAQESQMGDQRLQAYLDESDKQFNYDENMPYQMRIAAIRDQIKHKQQLEQAGVAYEAQTTSSMLSSIGGMGGGGGGSKSGGSTAPKPSTNSNLDSIYDRNYLYDPIA